MYSFIERHALTGWYGRGGGRRVVALMALLPLWLVDALIALPRDLWRAHRDGRTSEMEEHLRGLIDGVLNRPLPLVRLGLRGPVAKSGATSE